MYFTLVALIIAMAPGIKAAPGNLTLPGSVFPFDKYNPWEERPTTVSLEDIWYHRHMYSDFVWAGILKNLADIGIDTIDGNTLNTSRTLRDPNSHYLCRGDSIHLNQCHDLNAYGQFFVWIVVLSFAIGLLSSGQTLLVWYLPFWIARCTLRKLKSNNVIYVEGQINDTTTV